MSPAEVVVATMMVLTPLVFWANEQMAADAAAHGKEVELLNQQVRLLSLSPESMMMCTTGGVLVGGG